jgi:type VII secretion integral membrane protein EccD
MAAGDSPPRGEGTAVTSQVGTGLARVTIAAPKRRIDVALPEHVPLAELLPGLLRHAGDDLADEGEEHSGWALRRADGSILDAGRTLGAQNLRDGEVVHLVPRRVEWPELEYDDVVDAIASGSRRRGLAWSPRATRIAGLAISAAAVLVGLFLLAYAESQRALAGSIGLAVGFLLVIAGIVLSRAVGDSIAGAAIAAMGLPYAFTGGLLLLADDTSLLDLGAPHLLAGSAALLVASVIGLLGVVDVGRLFVAGTVAGLAGLLGALAGLAGAGTAPAAAVVVSVVVAMLPALPILSIRFGKLPMPTLPTSAEDLLKDEPSPPRPKIYAAVARADELLTGALFGSALVSAACAVLLIADGGVAAPLLAGVVGAAYLLRSRLFRTVRQRMPLMIAGVVILAALMIAAGLATPSLLLPALLPAVVVLAAVAALAGITYSGKAPSPQLGRWADGFDILLIVAVVPIACAVLGLYAYARGLAG